MNLASGMSGRMVHFDTLACMHVAKDIFTLPLANDVGYVIRVVGHFDVKCGT